MGKTPSQYEQNRNNINLAMGHIKQAIISLAKVKNEDGDNLVSLTEKS
jgi:hypothetical protein